MRQTLFFIICIGVLFTCTHRNNFDDVGDIPFDPQLDTDDFTLCDELRIEQYYVRRSTDSPPGYRGEKRQLEQTILQAYSHPVSPTQNGYLTIRFLVNCHGQTGRFRIEEMDTAYQPVRFNENISKQLLEIAKSLDGWTPRTSDRGKPRDYYQYLTFRIEAGQVVKIMP